MKKITQGVEVDLLDQEIKDLGVRVKVYKSAICPNMKSLESLDHDVNCKVCNNNMIDFNPKDTIAIFQQQSLVEQYKVRGTFHMDEVAVSFLSGVTLYHFSRVDLLDFPEDFPELVQRQEGTDLDRLKYSACDVIGCFVIRGTDQIEFHFGVDFNLDINGDIKWLTVNRPNDREIYTIYYRYFPIYRAIKAVHRDRFTQFNLRPDKIKAPKVQIEGRTFVKLPETWILKRDYLLERRDLQEALLPKNVFFDPNQ